MKAALVFFYSNNTLLVRKQSQCIIRTSFEQEKEVEVKCGGCPYVALILQTGMLTQCYLHLHTHIYNILLYYQQLVFSFERQHVKGVDIMYILRPVYVY